MFKNIFDPIDDSKVEVNSIKGKMILRKYINNFMKGGNNSNSKADLVLFYWEDCGPCKQTLPIWENVKEEIENSELNNKVNILKIERNNGEMKEIMEKHKIQSFPTIKLCLNGVDNVNNCILFSIFPIKIDSNLLSLYDFFSILAK